jgi:hypothetical protein
MGRFLALKMIMSSASSSTGCLVMVRKRMNRRARRVTRK